jgi:hypothetical protein
MTVAGDPGSYRSILSRTREARVLSRSGRDMQVYLRHGEGRINVSHVMLVRREAANLIRFWLDRSEPHDVDDAWGFLRADPWSKPQWIAAMHAPGPRSVITWGVLMRIDAAPLRRQLSQTIREYVMETPTLIGRTLVKRGIGHRWPG